MTATTGTFTDRVMAAVVLEPAPSPTRSLLAALRAGSWTDATAALSTAWHLSTARSWQIAPAARVVAGAFGVPFALRLLDTP